ncbi:hypothetical protein ACFX2G_040873 [Malus domestica]
MRATSLLRWSERVSSTRSLRLKARVNLGRFFMIKLSRLPLLRLTFEAEDEQIGDVPGTEQREASTSEVEDEAIRGVPGAKQDELAVTGSVVGVD